MCTCVSAGTNETVMVACFLFMVAIVTTIIVVAVAFKRKEVSKPVQAQDDSGGTQMVGLKRTYYCVKK